QLALKTLKSVVFDFQKKLEKVPAAHQVRRELLRKALAGLKEVAESAATSSERDHTLIWTLFELGDIFLLVGDLDAGNWTREAQRYYQQAHDVARALAEANRDDAQAQRDLSITYEK